MSFYPAVPPAVTLTGREQAARELLGRAGGVVAVRLADLVWPVRHGLGGDGRTALVAPGAGTIIAGDLVVFLKPVALAPAVVRRDGRVQAGGHPADHARLGVAERHLDALTGTPDTVGELARTVTLQGKKLKGAARRALTPALAVRLVLLMTLTPEADYAEVVDVLLGDLAGLPWHRPYTAPTATVVSTWRDAVGSGPLEKLRDLVLAGVDAEHRARRDRAAKVGDLDVCSADGSLTRVPDSPANRKAYGSAGTAGDTAPYPQLRELRLTDAATRATLAVVTGPSGAAADGSRDKGEAEQVLLDKALDDHPHVFTADRLVVMDRNFPGTARIQRVLATGTHLLVRVKDGVALRRVGERAPDHSYLALLSGGGVTLTVRVVEYHVTVAGQDTRELFCLVTDLLDHVAYPAGTLAEAYHWRWVGSETTLKEAKSTLNGAGPSTGPMLRSTSPALVAQEHAAWVVAVELTRAAARAAADVALPTRRGPRTGRAVHPREISFTAARRAVLTSVRTGTATASLPRPLADATHDRVLAALARRRVQVDRHRHRDRKTKARLGFPTTGPRLPTRTAKTQVHVCEPLAA